MLDDLKYIHQKDAQDALGVAAKQWQQLQHDFPVSLPKAEVTNTVSAGMGGSALWALLSTTWPGHKLPFEICRGYDIPAYVASNTLFIAASYSGNTEETLAALEQAEQRHAQIVVICAGGRLAQRAQEKGYPLINLPIGLQPRMAALYGYKALLSVLATVDSRPGAMAEIATKADFLQQAVKSWLPDVPTAQNYAKQLAQEIMGKSAVIYAGPLLWPAAYKWKISFNENAKNVAWCNQLPEFDHNEILGWTSHPVDKPYAVINFRSQLEHPRVRKRFEISERLLSGQWPAPLMVEVQGQDILEQLLWTVALGDFVSLYLALLNGLNPTPVDLIEKLKLSLDS